MAGSQSIDRSQYVQIDVEPKVEKTKKENPVGKTHHNKPIVWKKGDVELIGFFTMLLGAVSIGFFAPFLATPAAPIAAVGVLAGAALFGMGLYMFVWPEDFVTPQVGRHEFV